MNKLLKLFIVFLALTQINMLCQAEITTVMNRPFKDNKTVKAAVKSGLVNYAWNIDASAKCSHGNGVAFPNNTPKAGAGAWNVTSTVLPLNKNVLYGELAEHPTVGYAWGNFDAVSSWSPGNKKYYVTMTVSTELGVYASAKADKAKPVDKAVATADVSSLSMSLGSSSVSLHHLHGSATVTSKGKMKKKEGVITHVKWRDPLTLSLLEVETGQVYSRDLFAVNVDMDDFGNGAFTFDNEAGGEGVFLSCNADESINMYGISNCDWLITSYGDFSASLSGGNFSVSGTWASLPWELTYEDPSDTSSNVLSAFLSSDYLFSNLEWQIPESLMQDGYTYDLDLSWNDSTNIECEAIDQIPEPATLFMLSFGALILKKYKNQNL